MSKSEKPDFPTNASPGDLRLFAALNNLQPEPDVEPEPTDPLEAREKQVMNHLRQHEPEAPLEIRVTRRQGIPVIHLEGEVDMFTADQFRMRLEEEMASHPASLVIDLSGAAYIDSTGLGIILRAVRRMSGRLGVVSPRDRITRLFQAVGLSQNLTLFRNLQEAILAMEEG
ncbi:MAG: anti-sigma-factor antagonist [Armatimonadetes bacterium]|jgi:anti-sigma B factor antagonist|nr:anti-sigma-factor antagonist [Armatimonadota bacterium]